MKTLNMGKIATGLSTDRVGKVSSKGGYFGALQLLVDIETRFYVLEREWTERHRKFLTRNELNSQWILKRKSSQVR